MRRAGVIAGILTMALIGMTGSVFADPTKPVGGSDADPNYTEGVKAVKRGDYPGAIRLFEQVVAKDGKNADAYNWLGYSVRKNGDAAGAIPIYQKALGIDPKHRGAHEYIGEAYLILGDLAKAKEHLKSLDSICTFSCSEYRDLKKSIEAY